LREEHMKVIIDFKLLSNEILLFTSDNVIFTERSAAKGLLTGITFTPKLDLAFRKHRYSVG